MTRKHFERLAAELAYRRPSDLLPGYWDWLAAVQAVADTCSWANSRFDREKFYAACKEWEPAHALKVIDRA